MPPDMTYAEAVEHSARTIAQARLNDPDEHFPYKHDVVTELLGDPDAPMGPGVPEGAEGADDDSRTVADYMSQGIADASAAYIDAQAAWLENPTDENAGDYRAARDELVAARLDHRLNRGQTFTVGAASRRAG
jgi:hypothetical protein